MNRVWRSCSRRGITISLAFFAALAPAMSVPHAKLWQQKVDSSLALLYSLHTQHPQLLAKMAGPWDSAGVEVGIRSKRELTPSEDKALRGLGVHTKRKTHERGGAGAKAPWKALEKLVEMDCIDFIDSDWNPCILPCLDISTEETGARSVWSRLDQMNVPLTGKDIIIANFDTGVDVYHPGLWKADGGTYNWLDTNANGVFDAGVDCVDLNNNGVSDSNERLNYLKGVAKDYQGKSSNATGPYYAPQDWLYNDANGNGSRDYGLSFGEATPTYGEKIFILDDTNADGVLNSGERIIALSTSKVIATLASGATRTRGNDLILTANDTNGHGTSVCGIICGETPFKRRYVGLAPDAELLVADRYTNSYLSYMPWAEQRGANIMLHEFGSWIFQFLDGSSGMEQMMDAMSAKGIVQVAPAGNLANVKKHAVVNINPGGSQDIVVNVPSGRGITSVYASVVWTRQSSAVTFRLTNPGGYTYDLPGDMQFRGDIYSNLYWSNGVLQSPRATRRFDFQMTKGVGLSTGSWRLTITNGSSTSINFDAYVSDNLGVWSGGAYFQNHSSEMKTTCWPATADSAIVAGSYSTRGISVPQGEISLYSSEGPKIAGSGFAVDLCAPGNNDVFTIASKDAGNAPGAYRAFGGTSSAAAHVAAAVALALQANPQLLPDDVDDLIDECATTDTFTGIAPNNEWGFGKLNLIPVIDNAASPALHSIKRIREENADGQAVRLWGKIVSAVGNDGAPYCYVEDRKRISGIRVVGSLGSAAEGDKVEVTGVIETVNGERRVNASLVRVITAAYANLNPLAMNPASLGGSNSLASPGPWNGVGLNNVGLLVSVLGRVSSVEGNRFYLDGPGAKEAGIALDGLTAPTVGQVVSVTGASSLEYRNGQLQRLIRPRRQTDIVILK